MCPFDPPCAPGLRAWGTGRREGAVLRPRERERRFTGDMWGASEAYTDTQGRDSLFFFSPLPSRLSHSTRSSWVRPFPHPIYPPPPFASLPIPLGSIKQHQQSYSCNTCPDGRCRSLHSLSPTYLDRRRSAMRYRKWARVTMKRNRCKSRSQSPTTSSTVAQLSRRTDHPHNLFLISSPFVSRCRDEKSPIKTDITAPLHLSWSLLFIYSVWFAAHP